MKPLETLKLESENNQLSHAYLIIGGSAQDQQKIIDYIVEKKECSPEDISLLKPEEASGKRGEIKVLGVRNLLHEVYLTPNGKSRVAIICDADKLNQSSGNILLKSLEEPPTYLTYILTAKTDSILLTVKSRCRLIRLGNEGVNEDQPKYIDLIKNGFFVYSAELDNIVKSEDTDAFLSEIENHLRRKMIESHNAVYARSLKEVYRAKKDIASNANPRLTLECLCLKIMETI